MLPLVVDVRSHKWCNTTAILGDALAAGADDDVDVVATSIYIILK